MPSSTGARVIGVIPARFGSTRLAAKALALIGNEPMVVKVWRHACQATELGRVLVATDDRRIAEAARAAGAEAVMTSPAHLSGTDRVAEVAAQFAADLYLNIQGDLPFIAPRDLDALARSMLGGGEAAMGTLAAPVKSLEQWYNPNVVKVVLNDQGEALYFSRAPIPHARDGGLPPGALCHIGVYAYRRDFLLNFARLEPGRLEQVEKLEQLRVLEHGWRIRVVHCAAASIEVDTAEDLAQARAQSGAPE